ncbi:alpha/beta fold hydrolase [Paracoccus litorisediminis]|uniref:prolyl oligopeptidase family serine peptidase n=1 Tax=Paracoccus litorisediminis TaxID=2006130 RepID=UPI0037333FE9
MIQFHQRSHAGIAFLEAVPAGAADRPLPTLFVLHSFGVSKELVSFFGLIGAQRGLRVILPEAPGHGARALKLAARAARFWPIVFDYVDELAELHRALSPRIAGPVALAGTSMGAFAALAATARHDFVAATAAYMGSGYFRDAARTIFPPLGRWSPELAGRHDAALARVAGYDPATRLRDLARKPLYLWHGFRDDVVPVADTLRLADDLHRLGAPALRVEIDPAGGHRVTDAAARDGLDFLARALQPAAGLLDTQ